MQSSESVQIYYIHIVPFRKLCLEIFLRDKRVYSEDARLASDATVSGVTQCGA